MFLRSLVKLSNAILLWNFASKFSLRPKRNNSLHHILVLSQSEILDFLLPSGYY